MRRQVIKSLSWASLLLALLTAIIMLMALVSTANGALGALSDDASVRTPSIFAPAATPRCTS